MIFTFKVIARNPPINIFIIAALMIIKGSTSDIQELIDWGQRLLSWGVLLQALWLIFRYRVFND